MDLSNLRAITNDYQDFRLISLRDWKRANEIVPRDQGGPYVVFQQGYYARDLDSRYDEFLLGKSGAWVRMGYFLKLPRETRRDEFVFGTAAEVIDLLGRLHGAVKLMEGLSDAAAPDDEDGPDGLNATLDKAKKDASRSRPL